MGFLYKKTKTNKEITIELRTKNFYIFAIIIFLSLIPAIYIATKYFENNMNLFRIAYISSIIILYALLDGKLISKILFSKNKQRTGSVFSIKNPVRYTIKNDSK